MASNVFGTRITNEYLSKMEKYKGQTTFTRQERAKVAMDTRYAEGKDEAARNFGLRVASEIKKEHKTYKVITMCLYYNSTGDTLRLYDNKLYHGLICDFPIPIIIGNGQWGVFLCYDCEWYGCIAAVSYAGKNCQGFDVCWTTAFKVQKCGPSVVSADIEMTTSDAIHGKNKTHFGNVVKGFADQSTCASIENKHGASVLASVGGTSTSILETIMTLPGAFD